MSGYNNAEEVFTVFDAAQAESKGLHVGIKTDTDDYLDAWFLKNEELKIRTSDCPDNYGHVNMISLKGEDLERFCTFISVCILSKHPDWFKDAVKQFLEAKDGGL